MRQMQQQQNHQQGNTGPNSNINTNSSIATGGVGKGKFKAPFNTTQYIMHDYSCRMPALKDIKCPSELQQFSNDWDMALMQDAITPAVATSFDAVIVKPMFDVTADSDAMEMDNDNDVIFISVSSGKSKSENHLASAAHSLPVHIGQPPQELQDDDSTSAAEDVVQSAHKLFSTSI